MKHILTLWAIAIASIAQSQYDSCATIYSPSDIEPYHLNFRLSQDRTFGWKTIPTVIHIIYHDSVPNSYFTESYVDSAMASVNEYFAEAYIQFDYSINYKDLGDYEWAESAINGGNICFPTYGTHNTILANDIQWDRNQYCNIYIIPNICQYVLGWSYITNYITNKRDGVWVSHEAFGFGDWLPSRNNQNMCLVHELGHYCGLLHVFQGASSCLDDAELHDGESGYQYGDLVPDTPPITPSWNCNDDACNWFYYPDYPPNWNSARSWADYTHNNHMDYYPDSCRQMFTPGQIERMHLKLEFQRAGLFGGDVFCLGDVTGDGIVGIMDVLAVITNYGEHSLEGDIDNNGFVNSSDLQWVLNRYGVNCNDGNSYWMSISDEGKVRDGVRKAIMGLDIR